MIKWNKQFNYPESIRSLINDERHYDIGNTKLPSVTTILQATQPEEKRKSLEAWKQREGLERAEKIKNEAANRGSIMHRVVEGYLLGQRHADLSDLGRQAGVMAEIIYNEGLKDHMQEIWGTEVTLYYPGLYAGASDLVGIYDGRESIMDFKQANKPKRKEWITDYFLQLAAYATAHNQVYDTNINSGTILMCTKDNYFQKFTVSGGEFQRFMWDWLRRVDQYYAQLGKKTA
jgi:genome maintenance exonuclease 1